MKSIILSILGITVAASSPAQTTLQRCIGVVPRQEPTHPLGQSPATMQYCRQIPGWSLYDQAGERFNAGDHVGAARLALASAQAGNPLAQLRVAMLYFKGDGVPVNAAAGVRWLRAAVAQNEPAAESLMGTLYEYGATPKYSGYGVPDDWDTAAKLWQASAAQGWMNGEFDMGRAYQYGIGVTANQQSAIEWYDKAAAQGHAQAAYFAKYLRDNHGADASSRDDDERALLGPLMGRMFSIWPATGMTFHHLSERLAYVRSVASNESRQKAQMNHDMQLRRYQDCKRNGGDNCYAPMGPRPQ